MRYVTFSTSTGCVSKIIDDTDIIWTSNQMCYNFTDKSITSFNAAGLLERSINQFDSNQNFARTIVDVPVFAQINKTSVISNAGPQFWASSDPATQQIYIFKNTELFASLNTYSSQTINYGQKILVSEDVNNQPIIAIAYGKAASGSAFIDLYKPFVYNGTNNFFLWQQEALEISYQELESLQVQRTGMLVWIDGDS